MAVNVNICIHRVEEGKDERADGFGCTLKNSACKPLCAPESVRKKTCDLFQVEEVYVRERVNGQQGRKSLCTGSLRVMFVDSYAQLRGVKHQ